MVKKIVVFGKNKQINYCMSPNNSVNECYVNEAIAGFHHHYVANHDKCNAVIYKMPYLKKE